MKENQVAPSAEETKALGIGTVIPDVMVQDIQGSWVTLHQIIKDKAILIFYRGGWCPYCNTQLRDLAMIAPQLLEKGYTIVGITTDKVEEVEKTMLKHQTEYTIYSDSLMEAAKAFGIAFQVDSKTVMKYRLVGIQLEKASGQTHHLLPVPSVFITDSKRTIRYVYSNPNYKVRLKGTELLAQIHAQDVITQQEHEPIR
jgi:peroxiredoxin